jgi:hypothetical protein
MNRSNAIPTTLRGMLLAALAVIAAPGAMAAAAGNALQSVDVQPLGTQGVQLVLTTSGPAPAQFLLHREPGDDLARSGRHQPGPAAAPHRRGQQRTQQRAGRGG